mgnify:CR=1 FL=1
MEEEKLYFTEITEDEKKIINLIRTYVAPYGDIKDYVDYLVDNLVHKLIDRTTRMKAFIDVMQHERDDKNISNMEMLSRINKFENYIMSDDELMCKYLNNIFSDIVENLEGDIKPIEVYNNAGTENVEDILDKINNSWYNIKVN